MDDRERALLEAAKAALRAFTPFITAWEANEPMGQDDGEFLYGQLEAAVRAYGEGLDVVEP